MGRELYGWLTLRPYEQIILYKQAQASQFHLGVSSANYSLPKSGSHPVRPRSQRISKAGEWGGYYRAHTLVQDGDLILHAALFALQGLLGNAFDGHQLLSPLVFCQDYL